MSHHGWTTRLYLPFLVLFIGSDFVLAQSSEEFAQDDPPAIEPAEESLSAEQLQAVSQQIVERTNQFRNQHKLSALNAHRNLDAAAQDFAEFMARTGKYGHRADGNRPSQRVTQAGYEYCLVLENIAYRYRSTGFQVSGLAEGFVTGWEESPGHRKNMLNSRVTETGVGAAQAEDGGTYFAVQLFALPRTAQIEFRVENQTKQEIQYTIVTLESGNERKMTSAPGLLRTHRRCRKVRIEFPNPAQQTFQVSGDVVYLVTPAPENTWQVTRQQSDLDQLGSPRNNAASNAN